jgi:hypothetical protein
MKRANKSKFFRDRDPSGLSDEDRSVPRDRRPRRDQESLDSFRHVLTTRTVVSPESAGIPERGPEAAGGAFEAVKAYEPAWGPRVPPERPKTIQRLGRIVWPESALEPSRPEPVPRPKLWPESAPESVSRPEPTSRPKPEPEPVREPMSRPKPVFWPKPEPEPVRETVSPPEPESRL